MDEESEEDLEDELDEFRVRLAEADGYTLHPASSTRGGVQMRGDFLFEFYTERYSEPDAAVYSLTKEGDIGEHIRNEAYESAIIREKQVGVIMSQVNAFEMAIWTIANLLGDGVSESDVEDVIRDAFEDQIQESGESE